MLWHNTGSIRSILIEINKLSTWLLVISVTFEIIIWTWNRGVSNQIILWRWREMDKFLCEIVIILQLAAFNRHISEENISNSVSLSKRPKAAVGLSPGTPVMPLKWCILTHKIYILWVRVFPSSIFLLINDFQEIIFLINHCMVAIKNRQFCSDKHHKVFLLCFLKEGHGFPKTETIRPLMWVRENLRKIFCRLLKRQ